MEDPPIDYGHMPPHCQALTKGFPEVAVHFVREPKTFFHLALACGKIDEAIDCVVALEKQGAADGGESVTWPGSLSKAL